ncbi:MAG: autotransporter domain-containing protein [Alphaproteobacteria bacterium]|nr:autotransporter domain-containing protein [Alphaproteobacteria bacterium]
MKCVFGFLFLVLFLCGAAFADVVGGDKYISADLIVRQDEYYRPDSLHILGVVYLENNGLLETDVVVDDGATLIIENHACVNSVFELGNRAQVIQKVSDEKDMVYIDFDTPFSILVEDANMLHWDELVNFTKGADKIILSDSILDVNGVFEKNLENVELHGDVLLVADNFDGLRGGPFLTNVSGTGTIHVVSRDSNPLFADVAVMRNGDLYFERRREFDYVKVFNNDKGRFLNLLRKRNPGDKLLYTLDSVGDMDSFNRVLNHSARFNSEILMRPLRILNALNYFDYADGLFTDVWGVMSEEFYSYGISVGVHETVLSDLNVGVGLRLGKIKYDSDYDDYTGDLYGADLSVLWNFNDNMVVRVLGGLLYQNTVIGDVFYENRMYENPDVMQAYLKTDVGYKFDLDNSFYLDTYFGLNLNRYSVADIVDFGFNVYSAVMLGYEFDVMGITYNYCLGADINTDSDIGMHVSVGFMSDMDMIGGNAKFSAIRMFDVMTYKLSLNARLLF